MNNKFYPWAMPLQTSVPSQKLLPSQPEYGTVSTITWEQYEAMKKTAADEVRKSNKRKSNRKSYHRMKNNKDKYKKNLVKKRKYLQSFRAAKKEGVSVKEYISSMKNKEQDVAETLLSLGKED
jgi:hypothetical protein